MSEATIILITLVVYKIGLLGIGLWASRRIGDEQDFFLASGSRGGGLNAWTAGLSYAASTSSAWVLLGFTGIVFTQGLVGLWLIPGIFGGYVMTWLVMGPRLHEQSKLHGHVTIIDFVVQGMTGSAKRVTGLLCAALILFCFVFYISSQFQAAGNALETAFGLRATEAIGLGAVIIVIYCLLGGFWAASVTDALQAAVMMLACILVPIATLNAAGGFGRVIDTLHAEQPMTYFSLTGGAAGMIGLGVAMGLLGTGLGALGQPQLLNRIMAVRSQAERRRGAAITIGWGVIIYSGLITLAFSARALNVDVGGESLFFAAAQAYLPSVVAGVVIAAVLSAVMSTVDSLLLAAASAVSHDSGFHYTSPQRALFYGRLAMIGVAVFAVILTLTLPKDIFSRVLFSWVALGAAFGPVILLKCLGWSFQDGAVPAAIAAGFLIAVLSYNGEAIFGINAGGTGSAVFELTEKWLSWIAGLVILWAGRIKTLPTPQTP